MKLDVKLDHFSDSVIADATNQSQLILDEYQESLKKIYNDSKEESLRKARVNLRVETDNLIREKNKVLSSEATTIRRKINEKNDELKEKLFQEVQLKLDKFMKTDAYVTMLEKQIISAKEFAESDSISIYINPSDQDKKESLEAKTQTVLTVSTTEFYGGTRAVIPEKHILIDNSFLTKLAEEKATFRF